MLIIWRGWGILAPLGLLEGVAVASTLPFPTGRRSGFGLGFGLLLGSVGCWFLGGGSP